MRPPARPALRVLVKGASTASWISWMGGPRSDMAFPRVLEMELRARGFDADVRNTAVLGAPTKSFFVDFERDVAQWSPDVVVVMAGHYESIHVLLPRRFERFANRPNRRPGRLRDLVHRRVVRAVWKFAAELQAALDRRLPMALSRRRMRRSAGDLEGYIRLVQQVGSPMVVVLELLPPGARMQQWFPGMADRITIANQEHWMVLNRLALPHARMLSVGSLVRDHFGNDLAAAAPDGIHFSPKLHALVGSSLADLIGAWSREQPHLSVGVASVPSEADSVGRT